jgi:protein SCO1/2
MSLQKRAAVCGVCMVVMLVAVMGSPADGPRFTRTEVAVEVPDVILIDQNGHEVAFRSAVLGETPVFVEFIFATCTTICPVLSAGFASVQRKLGDERDEVHLISITIDPEHDGPEQMREYLDRYDAKSGWDFFTGTRKDIDAVMNAFDAYVADKMSHKPLTFVHAPGQESWIRINGFAGSKDLMKEVENAMGGEVEEGESHEDH